jgi:hypothetical protein
MDEKQIQEVIAEVLKRLAAQAGASGERGDVIVVFTGATAGFNEAIQQVRSLVIRGFRPLLVFSHSAELLYGPPVWKQLEGFPQVAPFDASNWLHSLKEAKAVVVPVLSVDTLSKLSLLLADNLASNLLLHALFAGKPLILAQNGVDPSDQGRVIRHFEYCGPVLAGAIRERMEVVRSYGCEVVDVTCLTTALEAALAHKPRVTKTNGHGNGTAKPVYLSHKGKIITAADVLRAQQTGEPVRLHNSQIITPLARELAQKRGVCVTSED